MGSTHTSGHTLDLVITRENSSLIQSIQVFPAWISDHHLVQVTLGISIPRFTSKSTSYRKWKELDVDEFNHDLSIGFDGLTACNSVCDLATGFNQVLRELVDKHVPLRHRTITMRPQAEWFTPELLVEKRKKRKLERRYRHSRALQDFNLFKEQCDRYDRLMKVARQSFYNDKIESCTGDQKTLFSVLDKLLHRVSGSQLPAHDSSSELANRFAHFFTDKIDSIRAELQVDIQRSTLDEELEPQAASMADFIPVSEEDVERVIRKSINHAA